MEVVPYIAVHSAIWRHAAVTLPTFAERSVTVISVKQTITVSS
jgi:hypothetical protein